LGIGLEIGLFADREMFRFEGCEQVHNPRDDSRPACLVVGPEPSPVVTMKILVEQQVVAPVRILLKLARSGQQVV
jgi:hypothetical protein